jgi:cyanate permease
MRKLTKIDVVLAVGFLVFAGLCGCLLYSGESTLAIVFGIGSGIAAIAILEKMYMKR